MKRLFEKLVQGVSRLAFWRKLADMVLEKPETPDPETVKERMPKTADAGAADAVPVSKTSWFARLKHALPRRNKQEPESPAAPDQAVATERPTRKQRDVDTPEDAPAVPRRSLLAVLKSKLRRAPPSEQLEIKPEADKDAAPSRAKTHRDSVRSRDGDSVEEDEASPLSPLQRALAVLSKKWVWIPGLSILLLVPLVTMGLMLVQSAQEKEQLQTRLLATQKKLDQAATVKKTAAKPQPPKPANATPVASADGSPTPSTDASNPGIAAGDCTVSDKESVAKNLKNCIEGFNSMAQ